MSEFVFENAVRHQVHEIVRLYSARIQAPPDKPEEHIEAVVRALWLTAAGTPVSAAKAATTPLPLLTEDQRQQLLALLEQRSRGWPLAYLTCRQHFMGLEYVSTPDALIPRKETELLGNTVRATMERSGLTRPAPLKVLDLCTGCGNLACAIAHHVPGCIVFASDLSPEAIELAHLNAKRLGVEDRVHLFVGDLFAPFESERFVDFFDLILCNPPYVSTAKLPLLHHETGREPRLAFDAGPLGLGIIWRLIHDSPRFLKNGGWLAFEAGVGQGEGLVRRLSRTGHFTDVQGIVNPEGRVRVVTAQHREYAEAPDLGFPA